MLTNHNDVLWAFFDWVEIYNKSSSLSRVFIRKNHFWMKSVGKPQMFKIVKKPSNYYCPNWQKWMIIINPSITRKISWKSQNFMELLSSAESSSQNEIFVSTSKQFLKIRNWIFAVAHYFTWKLKFVSNILWKFVSFLTWIWMVSD